MAAARRYAENPNLQHRNTLTARWRAEHPDKKKAQDARYRELHRKQAYAASALWGKAHPEKRKASSAHWHKVHAGQASAINARWRKAHPEKRAATEARRRARKGGNGVGDPALMLAFRERAYNSAKIRCYWCREFVPKGQRHIDHIIPLDKGRPDAEFNLCCACASCNISKGTKDPGIFSGQYELFLTVPMESQRNCALSA